MKKTKEKVLVPAILTDDIEVLKNCLNAVKDVAGWVQIDIMDGKYVNTKSVLPSEMIGLKTDLKLEAHLMVMEPEKYFDDLKKVGFKRIIFHIIAVPDPEATIAKAREHGFEVGVAVNPETGIEEVVYYFKNVDIVLLLGSYPGEQGQKFIPETIDKIAKVKRLVPNIAVEIDGGVKVENIGDLSLAGADILVVGGDIFESDDKEKAIFALKRAMEK